MHAKTSFGYSVFVTDATWKSQEGVALCWQNREAFEAEETNKIGPDVISFQLVTGEACFYVVGVYIPPSDLKTLDNIQSAWRQCPTGCKPLMVGDLNIKLESPRNERDETIAEELDNCALLCMSRHFLQRCCQLMQGR